VQRYANKIIGEERGVIFLRLAAAGFSFAAIGGTTIAVNVMGGQSVTATSVLSVQQIKEFLSKQKKAPKG